MVTPGRVASHRLGVDARVALFINGHCNIKMTSSSTYIGFQDTFIVHWSLYPFAQFERATFKTSQPLLTLQKFK